MSESFFLAWEFPFWVCLALEITAVVYCRGWWLIRKTRPSIFPAWRLVCFLAGIAAIIVALASPLDTFSDRLLFLHMAQHFVLMSVAPPLIVLAAPIVPLLRGLPRWFVRPVLGPLIRSIWLRRFFKTLVSLRVAWILMNAAYIGWHIPVAYELALRSWQWHIVEHACFLFSSTLFWWPVVQPWPSRFSGSRWLLLPYLLSADIVNTALSALLCFSGRVLYPSYADQPRMFGITALSDQAAAGSFMWVFGSIVFLIPALVITLQLLSPKRRPMAMQDIPSH
jgi:cytochrome c oxidase assembly factor CtaG